MTINGGRRNQSEPNASALGIELTEQASRLWPAHSYSYGTCDVALAIARRRRESGSGRERESVPGKHQRARQQHQRVGQIIPTYPLAPRERARRRARKKSGEEREKERRAPRRRRLFPRPRRPTSELFSLFLSLFPARIRSFSRSLHWDISRIGIETRLELDWVPSSVRNGMCILVRSTCGQRAPLRGF